MKCEHCGANLSIENAFCPNCGKANKFYEAHRADMEDYEERFKQTEEDVIIKTGIFSKRAVFVTTVAVLAVLILTEVILLIKMNDINYWVNRNREKRNATAIAAVLGQYEADKDILGFAHQYGKMSYYSDNAIREYLAIANPAVYYYNTLAQTAKLASGDTEYTSNFDIARSLNTSLTSIYNFYDDAAGRTDDKRYSEKHMEFCKYIESETNMLISKYCDIPMEMVESFSQMSETERFNVINEGVERVLGNGNN